MFSDAFALIVFVIGFGFLIFIHELGHFLVAKWVGIRCTQFAIGFGPAILSWRKGLGVRVGSTESAYHERAAAHLKAQGRPLPAGEDQTPIHQAADELGLGETEYRLNYLPLGGYVKMLGQEDLDPAARSANPNAFSNKSIGARFAVISAGVIMNMITGIVFFVIAFTAGVEFPPAVVGPMAPDSPAAQAHAVGHEDNPAYRGLRMGDRVLSIDGGEPMDYMDVRVAAALGAEGVPLELAVERAGEPAPLVYRVTPVYGPDGLLTFGIEQPLMLEAALLMGDAHDAYQAGVVPGMRATQANGRPIETYVELHQAITDAQGEPVMVTFEAPPDSMKELVKREARLADELDTEPREVRQSVEVAMQAAPAIFYQAEGAASILGFVPAVRISKVNADSPAEKAGLQVGDIIRQVDGTAWPSMDAVPSLIKEAPGTIEISVLRDGEVVTVGPVKQENGIIGIGLERAMDQPLVGSRLPDSPAAALDPLPGGFRLVSVAGKPVENWGDLFRTLVSLDAAGEEVVVPVQYVPAVGETVAETAELTLTAEQVRQLNTTTWMPMTAGVIFEFLREPVVADNPWDAAILGLRKTKSFIMQTYVMILRLFQGSVGIDQLHGPVGITAVGQRVAETGWAYLLYFLGILSVNLAVINFLPIPIADGGHAVFLAIEKLKGSPVSARVQVGAMYVGLVLLGGLFLLVTYNDIMRIAGFA